MHHAEINVPLPLFETNDAKFLPKKTQSDVEVFKVKYASLPLLISIPSITPELMQAQTIAQISYSLSKRSSNPSFELPKLTNSSI